VRSIERGSVVMTLEFEDSRQAEKLFLLIKLGELKKQGIFDARLKELIQGDKQNKADEKQNTGILQFCKDLKNLIKLGKIEEAIEQMFDNDTLVNDEYQNDIILYNSDLMGINKNAHLGIEDLEKIKIQRNKITYAVLNLIDKIAKSASHLSGGLEARFS
jgi:hypothetical protein